MKSLELFAGAGGLALDVALAGFSASAIIEWNGHCCDTLRENQKRGLEPITGWRLMEADVRNIDYRSIGDPIDLVSGGPPCQPFSHGGKHRGPED